MDYRAHVDRHVSDLLSHHSTPEIESLITLGIHHEQQHQELILTDIKHALWSQPLQPVYSDSAPQPQSTSVEENWIDYPGGVYEIGHSGNGFSFDNELPRHQVLLLPFRLASRLVNNSEFLEFVKAGGYREPTLWLSEAWDTVVREQWSAPLYWERRDNGWHDFTLSGWRPLDPLAPVCHISYFEADAYARFRNSRLPLEAEWEIAAASLPVSGNLAHASHSQTFAPGAKSPHQLFGDVWEWTASPYTAYPGYRPASGALGEYNGKFMCNQYVLRGGSCATPISHIRASYRNFFPAHVRWQFSGLRLAQDKNGY
ncbi:MAG: hypothetical protein NVS9B15_03510 [Acidobacteriaceae bacterium]